jgi:hypothetical protein
VHQRLISTGREWDAYAAAYRRFEHAAWFPDPYVGLPANTREPRVAILARARDARAGGRVVVLPRLARTGGEREDRFLGTVAPAYFAAMARWLQTVTR